ncbi:hypothetical protein BGZ70_005438, partial [Mortierella alpina]
MTETVKLANEASGSDDATEDNMRNKLNKTGGPLKHWKDVIEGVDEVWAAAVESVREDRDDHGESARKEPENIRTCTASLSEILRPELQEEFDLILTTLETTQNSVTVIMEELSVLALKTVHVLASGLLYGPDVGGPVTGGFDLRSVLPSGFVSRDLTYPARISVAPLPRLLETYIDLKPNSDLGKFLSQDHLQFLYARCLREPGASTAKGNEVHPLWRTAVDLIHCQELPLAPDGLSDIFACHMRQFSVAIDNLWSGPTHRKLLDFVVRVLLRLHLAPRREQAYRERLAAAVQRRRQEMALRKSKPQSKTKIKWRTAALFDELAEALDSQRPNRVQGILHQLYTLHYKASEPKLCSMDIVQEQQQQESKEQGEHAAQVEQQQQQGVFSAAVAGEEPVDLSQNYALDSLLLDEDLDMDELEDALEDMDRDANDNDEQEPSRKHLQALGAVLRMLLESPTINFTITASYVSKQAHKGKTFTGKECRV